MKAEGSDQGLALLLLALTPIFTCALIKGCQVGEMPTVAIPSITIHRSEQPYMFWVAGAYNALMLIGVAVSAIRFGL
jgi:hypothetical protein